MSLYAKDRAWSDLHLPEIKRLVAPHLLVETPFEVDAKQAADLMVITARNLTIAARVRRPGYADSFGHEFTIRSRRDSGSMTEMRKICQGFGDWMFYGHALHNDKSGLARWMLLDLSVFRVALIEMGYKKGWNHACKAQDNKDNATHFLAFDVRKFPDNMIIDSSHPFTELEAA